MKTTVDELELTSELLAGYDHCERVAILEHKYFLGIDMGFDPGLQCAVASWEAGFAITWRQDRHRADCLAQMAEIDRHRGYLSSERDCDIAWEAAARDWIAQHATAWREYRLNKPTA